MEIHPGEGSRNPRRFAELPSEVQTLCHSLLGGLQTTVADNLYGVYLYGAAVFPETRYLQDIDLHIIVKRPLTVVENKAIRQLHEELARNFPTLGDELDAWYILLGDAQQALPPRHQRYPDKSDSSWALHRAHMRAGYCVIMYGPDPKQVFPAPTWSELVQGLEVERGYVEGLLFKYPEYCVLNLCRLIYSYRMKNVVISKRASAEWALEQLATWSSLIEAALHVYERETREGDKQLLASEIERFYAFACERIIKESNAV